LDLPRLRCPASFSEKRLVFCMRSTDANLCKFMQIYANRAKAISESSINRQPIAGLGLASRLNVCGLRLHLESSSEMVRDQNSPKGGARKKLWFDLVLIGSNRFD
jgi:hypothetical protein